MDKKGLVIDDNTFIGCPEKLLGYWPNTDQAVLTVRTNAPWRSDPYWGDETARENTLNKFVSFVKANNARVLVGVDVTCNVTSDDIEWQLNLDMMKQLGAKHIMGLAVGNEMDILWNKPWVSPKCTQELWSGQRFWKDIQRRVTDLDKEFGSNDIKITSVWTAGFAFSGDANNPFMEDPAKALVRTLVKNAYNKYGRRWVWTFNPYPIWSGQPMDAGKPTCKIAVEKTRGLIAANMIADTRKLIKVFTKNDDDILWGGELGWSSPRPQGAEWTPTWNCPDYWSMETFAKYYEHFMQWDLTLQEAEHPEQKAMKGLDHAFFFTQRDSNNGGAVESFGLVKDCDTDQCKIQTNTGSSATSKVEIV